MKHNPLLRRPGRALAATALLGLVGAGLVSSPAAANPDGEQPKSLNKTRAAVSIACDATTGEWNAIWVFRNISKEKLTLKVAFDPATTPGTDEELEAGEELTVKQTFPGTTKSAGIAVMEHWSGTGDPKGTDGGLTISNTGGDCAQQGDDAHTTATLLANCDSGPGGAVMHLYNSDKATAAATFTVVYGDSSMTNETRKDYKVAPGKTVTAGEKDLIPMGALLGDKGIDVGVWKRDTCDVGLAAPLETEPVAEDTKKKDAEKDAEKADKPAEEKDESLAETGVDARVITGVAVLLLTIGGVLFVIARRRRTTFSAG